MATHDGSRLEPDTSEAAPIQYGGASSLTVSTGSVVDLLLALTGEESGSGAMGVNLGAVAGFLFGPSGDEWVSAPFVLESAPMAGRGDPLSGTEHLGRLLRLDKVFRSADRITYVGHALDQAGQPLRQYQIQFIGETVQENFAGTATDLNGVFVAYLTVGDTYTAFAFDPKAGFVYELVSILNHPNTVALTFRLKTRRGGFGEGIFLGSY